MLSFGIVVLLLVAQQHWMPMETNRSNVLGNSALSKIIGSKCPMILHVVEISSLLILLAILWCSLYFERESNCENNDIGCEVLGSFIIVINCIFLIGCVGLFVLSFANHHNLKRKFSRGLDRVSSLGKTIQRKTSRSTMNQITSSNDVVPKVIVTPGTATAATKACVENEYQLAIDVNRKERFHQLKKSSNEKQVKQLRVAEHDVIEDVNIELSTIYGDNKWNLNPMKKVKNSTAIKNEEDEFA